MSMLKTLFLVLTLLTFKPVQDLSDEVIKAFNTENLYIEQIVSTIRGL